MEYDDGEAEDLNMATQHFRFCPVLPLLDDSARSQTAADLTDSAPAVEGFHSTGTITVSVGPAANCQSMQPKLQEDAKPTALLDATNVGRDLSRNPEAHGSAGQVNTSEPVSGDQPSIDNEAVQDAAAASAACTAVPASKESDFMAQDAAAPQHTVDAFEYAASQAEDENSQQPAPSTVAQSNSNTGSGSAKGRGQKRAPTKQMAPAKRQKQLRGARGRAGSRAANAKQAGGKQGGQPHPPPKRSRLAEPALASSPSRSASASKPEAEPQGMCEKGAWQQTPPAHPNAGPHGKTSRQIEPCQDQQLQSPPSQQQLKQQQDAQVDHQQQPPANPIADQADLAQIGNAEVLMWFFLWHVSPDTFAAGMLSR